jgi:hypothetical protein
MGCRLNANLLANLGDVPNVALAPATRALVADEPEPCFPANFPVPPIDFHSPLGS